MTGEGGYTYDRRRGMHLRQAKRDALMTGEGDALMTGEGGCTYDVINKFMYRLLKILCLEAYSMLSTTFGGGGSCMIYFFLYIEC